MLDRLVSPLAHKFVAGQSIVDVVAKAKELNEHGFPVSINLLDEHSRSFDQALNTLREYKALIEKIAKEGLDANIAVKLSAFQPHPESFFELMEVAKKYGVFVWIDMEDSSLTDRTLQRYKTLVKDYEVGVALQVSLKRTLFDIDKLPEGSHIRLCKGAYDEPTSMSYKASRKIISEFIKCFYYARFKGHKIAIATHDRHIIKRLKPFRPFTQLSIVKKGLTEIQMLRGVNFKMAYELKNEGYQVRLYLPYGKNWFPYCIRRLRENPKFVFLLFEHILKARKKGNLYP
jgi:proline dehydrogenase